MAWTRWRNWPPRPARAPARASSPRRRDRGERTGALRPAEGALDLDLSCPDPGEPAVRARRKRGHAGGAEGDRGGLAAGGAHAAEDRPEARSAGTLGRGRDAGDRPGAA